MRLLSRHLRNAPTATLLRLAVLLLLTGCGVKSSEGPSQPRANNTPPAIWTVTASSLVVSPGEEIVLSCNASDDDGDPLTYAWENSDGWIADGQWTWQITWQAPASAGEVRVVAKVSDGFDLVEKAVMITVNGPPRAPFNPTPLNLATDVNPIRVEFTWQSVDDQGDDLSYDVYLGSGAEPELVAEALTDTHYVRSNLAEETTYRWMIVARDEHGQTNSGPRWSFTTGVANEAPGRPYDPVPEDGVDDVSTDAVLSWSCDDPDGNPLRYDIRFSPTYPPVTVRFSQTSDSYSPPLMTDNLTYYWQIVAKDNRGGETAGPIWSFTTGGSGSGGVNLPPAMPESPSPPNGSANQPATVSLAWSCSDPDDDPLAFDLYFGNSSTPPMVRLDSDEFFWTPPSLLEPGETYYWKVVARDGHGGNTQGPVWTFTVADDGGQNSPPNAPSAPIPLSGSLSQSRMPTLFWSGGDPDSDSVTYDLAFGISYPPPLAVQDLTSSSYAPGDLPMLTTWYWQVTAEDEHGAVTAGPIWSFTTGVD